MGKIKTAWYAVLALKAYIIRRLGERSSWMAIGIGVTAAGALASPWSFVFLATSIVGVLLPDGKVGDA